MKNQKINISCNNMFLVVGLGNPGDKFKKTRHNIGFTAVDFFAKENGFPDFNLSKKYESLVSERDGILLAKPQTFMNNSGVAVKKIIRNLKLEIRNLVVIHDDLDLPLGKLKIVKNRGSAGHKGVKSVIKSINTKDFVRIRVGIQPTKGKPKNADDFVIKNFTGREKEIIDKTIKKISDVLDSLIKNGLEKTMNKFNG